VARKVVHILVALAFCDMPVAQVCLCNYLFALRQVEAVWIEPRWVKEFVDSAAAGVPYFPVEKSKAHTRNATLQGEDLTARPATGWLPVEIPKRLNIHSSGSHPSQTNYLHVLTHSRFKPKTVSKS